MCHHVSPSLFILHQSLSFAHTGLCLMLEVVSVDKSTSSNSLLSYNQEDDNLLEAEVEVVGEEEEGVVEEEEEGVAARKEQMSPQKILMPNWMLTMTR